MKVEKTVKKDFMRNEKRFIINETALKKFGIKTSLFLSFLLQIERQKGNRNDWFHINYNEIEEIIGLSYYQQAKCINELQKANVLECVNKGIPRKKYFKINHQQIKEIIEEEICNQ
jgi:hypothetical protein